MPGFTWTGLKPMPTKRVFSTPVEAKGQLYVAGGCDARGQPLDTFESYTFSNKKWNRLMNMPSKRAGTCALAVGTKVVVMGGVNLKQEPVCEVEVYDIEKKQWESGDHLNMKDKLLGLSGIVREDKIYVAGGMGIDTNPRDTLMCFDPATNKWSQLPRMNTPRYATFSFLIDDKLYVVGGRQGKVPCTAFERFDFKENKWEKLEDIPTKRVFALYTHSDTHIYSLGGLNENPKDGFSDDTQSFSLETLKWTIGKPMPTKRGDFAAGFLGDKVIAAGGLGNDGKPLNNAEAYDVEKDEWTILSGLPSPHCSCSFYKHDGRLYVIGGLSVGGPSGAMESLAYS